MIVPDSECLCRFVPKKYWNSEDSRPLAHAFRHGPEISVFSHERVENSGFELSELAFGYLAGNGQAHVTVFDYRAAVIKSNSPTFNIEVVWRPEKTADEWVEWKDAHAQVEGTSKRFPLQYCIALSIVATHLVLPG